MASVEDWARTLGRLLRIGDAVIVTNTEAGTVLELPCHRQHTARFEIGRNHLPADVIVKKMRQKNWACGRRLYCPDHNPAERNVKRITREITNQLQENREMAGAEAANYAEVPPSPTSEQAREARRMCHMMIEDKFDIVKGCYKDGYTDKKIADECGVSEHWVTRRRDEEFGPLKEPPEIEQARAELDALEARLQQHQRECATFAENMQRDITAHRARLAGLVRANSWKI